MSARPASEICDIYWVRLDALRPWHARLLSVEELGRRDAYRLTADRDRFTLGAALLRIVVGMRRGVAPERVEVDRRCPQCGEPHGRPRVPGADVEVSVSHSGDVAGLALHSGAPVGLDVEELRPIDFVTLLDEVCSPSERGEVRSLPDFYTCWTRKESVLKATGVGLTVPMAELIVTPPRAAPRLLEYRGGAPLVAQLADASPGDGYAGAVTVLGAAKVTFREHVADHLLTGG
jgi:4'-phosphopantetheinyl transferase